MDVLEAEKIVLFVLFVIHGFVTLKIYELMIPGERVDGSQRIVDAVTYSCLTYALLSPLIYAANQIENDAWQKATFGLLLCLATLIVPACLVFGWRYLRLDLSKRGILKHPVGRPWDFVFEQPIRRWVKVTLNDGGVVGGYFGPNSFSSSAPEDQEIYLEQSWVMKEEGGFERMKKRTAGILLMAESIAYIEFFEEEADE